MWHGQFLMIPAVCPRELDVRCMVARHGDAEIVGRALGSFGFDLIRGAGAGKRRKDRGGAHALRAALKTLEEGKTVAMTADIPPGPARQAGEGIVTLARMSGRPIIPIAVATSRFRTLNSWSRFTRQPAILQDRRGQRRADLRRSGRKRRRAGRSQARRRGRPQRRHPPRLCARRGAMSPPLRRSAPAAASRRDSRCAPIGPSAMRMHPVAGLLLTGAASRARKCPSGSMSAWASPASRVRPRPCSGSTPPASARPMSSCR